MVLPTQMSPRAACHHLSILVSNNTQSNLWRPGNFTNFNKAGKAGLKFIAKLCYAATATLNLPRLPTFWQERPSTNAPARLTKSTLA